MTARLGVVNHIVLVFGVLSLLYPIVMRVSLLSFVKFTWRPWVLSCLSYIVFLFANYWIVWTNYIDLERRVAFLWFVVSKWLDFAPISFGVVTMIVLLFPIWVWDYLRLGLIDSFGCTSWTVEFCDKIKSTPQSSTQISYWFSLLTLRFLNCSIWK